MIMNNANIATPSLANNISLVAGAWVVSSAILTTYSTTAFLKFPKFGPDFLLRKNARFKGENAAVSECAGNVSSVLDRATLLTLLRFGGSFLLGLLARSDLRLVPKLVAQTVADARYFIPSAVFLFVANYCNSIALNRLGVPLTYTSKGGIPIFTVLFVFLLDGAGALPNTVALYSLVLIAFGIAAASWNSPTFDALGFLAAAISTTSQAALNIASKRAIALSNTSGVDAQRVMVAIAFIIATSFSLGKYAIWFLKELKLQQPKQEFATLSAAATKTTISSVPPFWLALLAVTAYHIEYCLSFMFVRLVTPITYGTCDAVRRLSIILAGKSTDVHILRSIDCGPLLRFLTLVSHLNSISVVCLPFS